MASYRVEKMNGQIQRELSLIIQQKMKDNRLKKDGLSVTKVDTTGDLKQCTVYVSILGTKEDKENAIAALESGRGFLRANLGKVLKTFNTPALNFKIDDSVDYSMHIEALLSELKKDE